MKTNRVLLSAIILTNVLGAWSTLMSQRFIWPP